MSIEIVRKRVPHSVLERAAAERFGDLVEAEPAKAGADALTLLTSSVFLAGGEPQGGAGGAQGGYEVVPLGSPSFLLGVVPPSGVLQQAMPTALFSGREQAEVVYLQPTVRDPVSGVSTLGAPSLLVECRR